MKFYDIRSNNFCIYNIKIEGIQDRIYMGHSFTNRTPILSSEFRFA